MSGCESWLCHYFNGKEVTVKSQIIPAAFKIFHSIYSDCRPMIKHQEFYFFSPFLCKILTTSSCANHPQLSQIFLPLLCGHLLRTLLIATSRYVQILVQWRDCASGWGFIWHVTADKYDESDHCSHQSPPPPWTLMRCRPLLLPGDVNRCLCTQVG